MYFDTKRGKHTKSGFMYFCTKCGHYHYSNSKIGQKHLKYYNPDILTIEGVLNTLTNPPYCHNPGVKELSLKLYEKLLEMSKRGAPLAKKYAKRIGEAFKIGTKELVETFRKLRKYRFTTKQLRELAMAMEVLWRSGLLDLDLSEDERKRRKELMTLIKYGLIDPETLKQVITKKLYKV